MSPPELESAVDSRVLVLNCGSSSVKFRVTDGVRTLAQGLVERIGEPAGAAADHDEALRKILAEIDVDDLTAVGHRVVHGGELFRAPTLITDEVHAEITRLTPLAPLHNPANLAGIDIARALLPRTPQVAVFDTAFHATMPEAQTTFAIDRRIAQRLGIRRYGFHGTSHAYVSRRTAALLDRPLGRVNTITLHLGNGASACAVAGGRSVATSMGLSPLPGLVMGTRGGDLDPAIVVDLQRSGGMTIDEVDSLLNHHSGLFGICGDNDMRAVLTRRASGDVEATLAFDVYCARIKFYVGAYAALLGRLDAVTFTAGVGEHSAEVRAAALANLPILGIEVDPVRNTALGGGERVISPDGARVSVLVVPTDEELEIALQTLATVQG